MFNTLVLSLMLQKIKIVRILLQNSPAYILSIDVKAKKFLTSWCRVAMLLQQFTTIKN